MNTRCTRACYSRAPCASNASSRRQPSSREPSPSVCWCARGMCKPKVAGCRLCCQAESVAETASFRCSPAPSSSGMASSSSGETSARCRRTIPNRTTGSPRRSFCHACVSIERVCTGCRPMPPTSSSPRRTTKPRSCACSAGRRASTSCFLASGPTATCARSFPDTLRSTSRRGESCP